MLQVARLQNKFWMALLVLGMGASTVLAQNFSIPAGYGTLTYTETQSRSGTCPVGSPTGPQQPITVYTFNNFAFQGTALVGSVAWRSSPGGTYCPSSGWQGTVPAVLTGSNYTVFFTPPPSTNLGAAGTAGLDALTLSASTPNTYGGNVWIWATQAYQYASGTIVFYDGTAQLGSPVTMTNSSATFTSASQGVTLSAGTHSIHATYSGSLPAASSGTLNLVVNKASPSITWPTASAITYGQSLASSSLSGGSASTGGTFSFSSPSYVPGAGTASQTVIFTPSDTSNYNTVSGSVSVTVYKVTPSVTWPTASTITYGQSLASSSLSGGSASTGGTFSFSSPSYVPGAGTASQTVIFTPSDTSNYNTVSGSVSVTVYKATPSVTWPTASAITYGQSLASSSLSGGSASTGGTFSFSSPSYVPGAGTASQTVIFTPSSTSNYNTVSGSVSVTVYKVTPSVTWPTASAITYGQSLASSSLSGGSASTGGTFSFSSPSYVPGAGTASQTVIFTPSDTSNYNTVSGSVSVTVYKATPSVTWPAASAITYGQSLASSSLSGGSASTGGTFSFSSPSYVPGAGTASQTVIFTPSSTSNYNTVSGSVSVTVYRATPSVTWPTASAITYGQSLASSALSGGSSSPSGGVFGFTNPSTTPDVGTASQPVVYTPSDSSDYNSVAGSVSVTVNRATPVITWATPATVPNGTFLTSVQLNATANIGGTFSYNPASGTWVTAGTQQLGVTFTPADGTRYTTVSKTVTLRVSLAPATGIIATIAGNNIQGYSGDGGSSLLAELNLPAGVAVDTAGNIYIADEVNNVVRKVTASTSTISTVAGNGTAGYAGNGGAALSAELYHPLGVAVDSAGNLYIADSLNSVIRKVTTSGIISSVAGVGTAGYSGDGGAATSARLNYPNGVAVDTSGNLYIADTNNFRVRKVNSGGVISTVAGNGTAGFSGDGGQATAAQLSTVTAVAVDSSGNVFIADENNERVREVTPSGTISTIAGNGTVGYSGDGGAATAASLHFPRGLAVDAGGNVYIADQANQVIRKVSSVGIISDAGSGIQGYYGDWDQAIFAQISNPAGLAIDSAGNLFVADSANSVVRAVGGGKIMPMISWQEPLPIRYGTALGSAQFNASAGVAGTFQYSPASGTVLSAGYQYLQATFNPTDTYDYIQVTMFNPILVEKATPVISWSAPAPIARGTPLSVTQLNATTSVPGTFVYTPGSGTVLPSGSQLLTATFTPSDTTDYEVTTANVAINIQAGTQKQDSGTVTLSVDTGSGYAVVASTNYGAGATPGTIAQGLANGVIQNSPVTVSAVNDQVTIVSTATGSSANYPFVIQTSSWDSADFAQPSFATVSGSLDGGAPASSPQNPVTVYSFSAPAGSYDGAGNLLSYNDTVMGGWSFSYDTLNRLTGGSATSGGYSGQNLCWAYDAFGNRTMQTILSSACTSNMTPTANYDINNQLTGGLYSYDQAGDVVQDARNAYLYDAEGRICAVANNVAGMTTMVGYMYDADGIRVSKGTIQQWSCDPGTAQFTAISDYILGPGGEQMSEYVSQPGSTQMVWQHTNVWVGGRLLATYAQGASSSQPTAGLLHFYFDDPLGTRRAQTDYVGNLEQTCSSLPYGDAQSCAPLPTEHLFTGKERDAESGNDYFGARYYASTMGRFLSADWSAKAEPVPYAKLEDPQSLNLYAYVLNNPMTHTDPTGHVCFLGYGSTCKNPPPPPTPPAPGLPSGVVHLTYWKNALRLNAKVEAKLQKELGAPGVLEATVGYTTNGKHAATSNHYKGLAADIETINGTPMTNQARDSSPDSKAVIDNAVQYANQEGAHEVFAPGGQTFKDGKPFTASTPAKQQELVDLHATHLHITVGGGDE